MNGSRTLACLLALVVLTPASATRAADMVLLQHTLPLDQAGGAFLQIDRDRLVSVNVKKLNKGSFEHSVSIILDTQPPSGFAVYCVDVAAARQVLDALRPGGPTFLDVTARCRL